MKRTTWAGGWSAWALSAALLALPCSAFASLGGDVASVQVDQARMRGALHVEGAFADHTVHEIRLPGGTRVREYVSAGGTVFGLAWQGPFRPDLRQLLGPYFDPFQQASEVAKSKRAGRGPLLVDTPELVVHMGGHPRAFFGRAYVPGLLPTDFSVDEIQ